MGQNSGTPKLRKLATGKSWMRFQYNYLVIDTTKYVLLKLQLKSYSLGIAGKVGSVVVKTG